MLINELIWSLSFFSYSHIDEELRNELDKHLSILKRQGVISTWHDRRITAGSDLDVQISNHLKNANIIVLLISSDFLASDYCYDKEMQFAMQLHNEGKAVVIPVILRPCDWHNTPFGKLLATPKDGKPIVKHPTIDEGFLDVTTEIRRVVQEKFSKQQSEQATPIKTDRNRPLPRSSNLSVRKEFSDQEKDTFLDEAFEYISNYFEGSLEELKKRNPQVDHRFKRVDSQTFTAQVYIGGRSRSECMVYLGSSMMGRQKSINYSNHISNGRNSLNQSLTLEEDSYMLYLRPLMNMFYSSQRNEKLTFEGASESFWQTFIEPLQRA